MRVRHALSSLLLLLLLSHRAQAQDSLPPVQESAVVVHDSLPAVQDTVAGVAASDGLIYARAPVSPMGAFWRSLLLPGWGQAKLNRRLTGAVFVVWEGVTLGMTLKTSHELRYLEQTGSGSVNAKKKEQQDWIVLLAFNHLLAGIEGYVSAHLWDFPDDLSIRAVAVPGGAAATISFPFPRP